MNSSNFEESVSLYWELKKKYRNRDIFELDMVNNDFFHNHVWKHFLDLTYDEHYSLENKVFKINVNYEDLKERIKEYKEKNILAFKPFFEIEYENYWKWPYLNW